MTKKKTTRTTKAKAAATKKAKAKTTKKKAPPKKPVKAKKTPTQKPNPLDHIPGTKSERFGRKFRVRFAKLALFESKVRENANVGCMTFWDCTLGTLPSQDILKRLARELDIAPEVLLSKRLSIRYS